MTKTVVITGSTRGIGRGLADAFLERGHHVVVGGRSQGSTEQVAQEFSQTYGNDRVLGCSCDVSRHDQVMTLWEAATARFGQIDIWINNAGLGNPYKPAWEQTPDTIQSVIQTNLIGTMIGTTVAYNHMHDQGHGQIYNMQGFGSTGSTRPGMAIYGTSKRAIDYYSRAFIEEIPDDSPVQIGTLSPGMVVTDMLIKAYDDPAQFEQFRSIFNILCEPVSVIAPWLVERILRNNKHGTHIRYGTPARMMLKFLKAPFVKRDLFAGETIGQ